MTIITDLKFKKRDLVLASVVQLVEPHPMHREVPSLIPGQGACPAFELHTQ